MKDHHSCERNLSEVAKIVGCTDIAEIRMASNPFQINFVLYVLFVTVATGMIFHATYLSFAVQVYDIFSCLNHSDCNGNSKHAGKKLYVAMTTY